MTSQLRNAANRTRRIIAVAVVASITICATSDAKIVLGTSIAGVKLGITRPQVARILGTGTPETGDSQAFDYRHDSYQVIFTKDRASSIETFTVGQRTSRQLGVRTSLATLHARQPDLRCVATDGERDCYVGSVKRGHRYTDFYFQSGQTVAAVIVGFGYI